MKPLAIVICSHFPVPITSGGRKRSARLIEAMDRAGLEPVLLTDDPAARDHVQLAHERGWSVEVCDPQESVWAARFAMHVRGLPAVVSPPVRHRLRTLLGPSVALVEAEEYRAAGYLLDIPTSIPTVLSVYNTDSEVLRQQALHADGRIEALRYRYRARRTRRVEHRAARRSSAVLCVSEHDQTYYSAAGAGERAILVPNGVDEDFFAVAPADGTENVLFFGGFDYWPNCKGVARFLPEWPRVAAARPLARLRLAGARPPAWLTELANSLERVDVLGFVDDLEAELASCRVVVVPLWQGGGTRIKVLEAMAAGRPIASTFLGVEGIGFRPGEHGECVDDPAELAARVISFLEDAERAQKMGLAARQHARDFRWSVVTHSAETLYRELAERKTSLNGAHGSS